jgi:hypothetical protein
MESELNFANVMLQVFIDVICAHETLNSGKFLILYKKKKQTVQRCVWPFSFFCGNNVARFPYIIGFITRIPHFRSECTTPLLLPADAIVCLAYFLRNLDVEMKM